ncbi:ATP-binding protein [Streptomyces sirii]|uniref:ATP-binding protein n=1 Tax=Streptomyces sirii TaxID=3127701 RepID=UPI003D3618E4
MDVGNAIDGGYIGGPVLQAHTINVALPRPVPQALGGLPPRSGAFTGREADLQQLTEILRPHSATQVVVVSAVAGLGGMGKTELVVQAAHRGRENGWFPGGVLFLDLFGYDQARRLSTEHALDKLLRALGLPAKQIPADTEDRARLYRSALAERAEQGLRTLVVLDNASAYTQIRPLLPADPRVPALITSRNTLAGLEARLLDLDALSTDASIDLLRKALRVARPDDSRVDDQPHEAAEIVRHCGHLPLALRIVAAVLAEFPNRPLASIASTLADASRRLDILQHGDRQLRAVFDLSYQHLSRYHTRALRLLAHNPGPDISTDAAVHLLQRDTRTTESLLQDLARDHMIEPGAEYGRWRLHDLVRLYAVERTNPEDGHAEGLTQMLMHLIVRADDAATHLQRTPRVSRFSSLNDALSWLDVEYHNLLAFAPMLSTLNQPGIGVRLLDALDDYHRHRGLYDGWATVGAAALKDSALDIAGQVQVRQELATALLHGGRFPEASGVITRTLRICRDNNLKHEEAANEHLLGWSLTCLQRHSAAVEAHRRAFSIKENLDHFGVLRSEDEVLGTEKRTPGHH